MKAIEEIQGVLCAARFSLSQVDGAEAEALDKLMEGVVVVVDEFAAPLAHRPIPPGQGIGVHATADAVRRFVDAGRETGVLQGKRGVESRDSRAHDGNPWHCWFPPGWWRSFPCIVSRHVLSALCWSENPPLESA